MVKICLLALQYDTPGRRNRRRTIPVEFPPIEMDVLDHECFITRVVEVDYDPLGIRVGPDVPYGFG